MPTAPTAKFESWLKPDASGLLCEPGGFHIDPLRPVERAIITHGHSDHAPGPATAPCSPPPRPSP
jgi:putative mRNA 3-end processing factor